MPLLPGQQALQRARALRDLTDACEIHRYSEVTNDLGERVKAWAPVGVGIPCRVAPTSSSVGQAERLRLEGVALVSDWVLVLPWAADITSKDVVYVTSPAPVRRFEVNQVLAPHTAEVRRRIFVDEVS